MERTDQQRSLAQAASSADTLIDGKVFYEVAKSAFDHVAAVVGLIVLAPIMAAIAIAIRLDSKGPVIFCQKRVGRDGKPFVLFKFRTMHMASDDSIHRAAFERFFHARSTKDADGASFKVRDDPRVTRVGRFLRSSSLDELPQLVNVLKGDMSLVGPRPPISYETQMYQSGHWRRLAVQPGITGLWQVSGRGVLPFEEMVRLDLEYIARRSLLLDLRILALTVGAVLSGRGAG